MTINEEKALKNYIKGLIKENLNEMPLPKDFNYSENLPEPKKDDAEEKNDETEKPDGLDELRKLCEGYAREALFGDEEGEDEDFDFDGDDEEFDDEHYGPFHTQDYGIYELRKLCEGMAREALKGMLSEGKKKGSKKSTRKSDGKKKGSKKSPSSAEKSLMSKLNSDGVNAASYYYKLYGAETEAEKAAARSKGYKKAKGKKNDSGARYKFSPKERTRLNSMLTDR